jgi:hypothetical protein
VSEDFMVPAVPDKRTMLPSGMPPEMFSSNPWI